MGKSVNGYRFHVVSEFDESKRSCRRRLAGHNERRRKSSHDSLSRTSSQGVYILSPYRVLNFSCFVFGFLKNFLFEIL